MITKELVNRSIDYIMQHIDEEISIEDVAEYCHFSKYYFSRVFKAETGESIYSFIKRLKMEQSAINLKLEKEKTITDIGAYYGYSSSNYSSAFKKHHNVSPAVFRKTTDTTCVPNPFKTDSHVSFQSFEEYDKHMIIQELDDFLVIYERYIGNYIELGKNWSEFMEKHKDLIKEDTLLIERFYDDPVITSVGHCLYDICLTVDKNCTLDNITTIKGGKYAVYRFEGAVEDIFTTLQGIFNVWLAGSSYEMDERYGLDIYRMIEWENMRVIMDLCIPVK